MENIRKFNKSVAVFILFFVTPYIIYGSISMATAEYKKEVTPEIYDAIRQCKNKEIRSDVILFTDSAGAQLYKESQTDPEDFFVVNTTRAIGVVGQYLLLKKLIKNQKNNMQGKTVYLLLIPSVFMDRLDQKYTYNYFIKPFYNDEFLPYLEEHAKEQVESVPMHWASQLPLIKTTNWSVDLSNAQEFFSIEEYHISDLSMIYLKKMKDLANKHHFELSVKSPYMREDKKNVDNTRMLRQIKKNNLEDIFTNYFEDMKYLPDSLFVDRDHFDEQEYQVETNPLKL